MRLITVTDGSAAFFEPGLEDLDELLAGVDWFWLDVDAIETALIKDLGRRFGLDPVGLDDVLAVSEFPKSDDYDDHTFFTSHGPAVVDERITTAELDGFVSGHFLLTFHRVPIPGVEWTRERLRSAEGRLVLRPDALLVAILEAAARRSLHLVDGLESQITELESLALAGDPTVVGLVQTLRRDTLVLRRTLAPERDMVRSLTLEGTAGIGERARRRLDSVYDDCYRVVESLDLARALLASVLETYRSTVAERTNEVMKVLTVFAAIVLPLSLLAGIYGMNFSNMPELSWPWAYFVLLGLMASVGVGLWLYFVRRGFIGGPRLPRVDRAVGRGLADLIHLTTAPVRGVLQLLIDEPEKPRNSV